MSPGDKPLVWLERGLRTPPLSTETRIEAGMLLRRLQRGEKLSMPHSRPMPSIGRACHELRVRDETRTPMDKEKQKCLSQAGWRVGSAAELLDLRPEEELHLAMNFSLAGALRARRAMYRLTDPR